MLSNLIDFNCKHLNTNVYEILPLNFLAHLSDYSLFPEVRQKAKNKLILFDFYIILCCAWCFYAIKYFMIRQKRVL